MRSRGSFVRHLETDDILFSSRDTVSRRFRVKPPAQAIIADSVYLARFLLLAHLVESLWRAKAGISIAFLAKQICIILINLSPLRLAIRSVLPAMERALIRRESKPVQAAQDLFLRPRNKSFLICIFEAQDKLSACLKGNQISKKGVARVGKMESPCWRGSYASTCG